MYRTGRSVIPFPQLAVSLLLALVAAACGPSDHFRSMDANNDRSVDLQEWMAYYGPHEHSWDRCSGRDFEPADCDGDRALSWPEYHAARFKSDYCGDTLWYLMRYQKPKRDANNGRYAILPSCKLSLPIIANLPAQALATAGGGLPACEPSGDPSADP